MNRMGKCRLVAKGEEVEFQTVDGVKKYTLKPIKNKQLLEVMELVEQKKGMEATLLLARHSINRDPKIVAENEKPFDEEEIKDMETVYLMQIMKVATKINDLEDMFDFQSRTGEPMSEPKTLQSDIQKLKKNSRRKL